MPLFDTSLGILGDTRFDVTACDDVIVDGTTVDFSNDALEFSNPPDAEDLKP